MSTSEDHEGLANELERETDALQRESDKLGQEISGTRSDWEAKRSDPSVPGAPPPDGGDSEAEDASDGEPAGRSDTQAEQSGSDAG